MDTNSSQQPGTHDQRLLRVEIPVDWFKRAIDLLSIAILLGGFYFTYDQANKINLSIRESRHNNDLAVWNSVSQQWLALDKIFIDKPEMRKYVFSGVDIQQDDPKYPEVQPYVTFVVDFIDYVESSYDPSSKEQKDLLHPEAWEIYFMQIFARSPLACREVLKNEPIYNPQTRKVAHSMCEKSIISP